MQDPHHYTTTTYSHSPVKTTKTKDSIPLLHSYSPSTPLHVPLYSHHPLPLSLPSASPIPFLSFPYTPLSSPPPFFDTGLGLKIHAVGERGETLITVPCWWDGDVQRFFYSPPPPVLFSATIIFFINS